jgi:hypothetical protein
MEDFSQKVITLLDKGLPITTISQYFGGIENFIKLTNRYPYLSALIRTKLSGYITIYTRDENDRTISKIELPFQIIGVESVEGNFNLWEIFVDLNIPEITDLEELSKLISYLSDYGADVGGDWATLNDKKLDRLQAWVTPVKINGLGGGELKGIWVTEEEIDKIIPNKYKLNK